MSKHVANGVISAPLTDTGPGTILVDPLGSVIAAGTEPAVRLAGGGWTVKVNGTVSSQGSIGVWFTDTNAPKSKVVVGADGKILGGADVYGIVASHGADITNAGRIAGGFCGVDVQGPNDYRITNSRSGTVEAGEFGIIAAGTGIHTIVNLGSVSGRWALLGEEGSERVTNGGVLSGYVFLGDGDDVFTNHAKSGAKVLNGFVDGTIALGYGNDTFLGGAKAEVVNDGPGKDKLKFGGGADLWIGLLSGDSPDTGDGGAGTDTYDASQSNAVAAIINLDKVAHRDTYHGRDLGAQSARDFGNPGQAGDRLISFENAIGTDGNDSIFGTAGANVLDGGKGADTLYGLAGNDRLIGGNGLDYLIGGAGKDRLEGGGSSDTFVFNALTDSRPGRADRDVIVDFENADLIQLKGINQKLGGVVHFIGNDIGFSGAAGELRAIVGTDHTIVQLDADGDKKVDFAIELIGRHPLTDAHFVL